ncbi:MAG: HlyC/CorC family transporter [Clostridiaceae bacterium]|nr:HlyC/CorC family transporter [Clostridiaceae bacterium]
MSDVPLIVNLLILFILILINAFFSATEIAVITLNDNKVRKDAEEGNQIAGKLLRLIEEPGSFLATIQVGVTLAGFLSSAFAADIFADRLYQAINVDLPIVKTASVIVITIILAYFSLVFGELVPKRIAQHNPEKLANAVAGIITMLRKVMKPFVFLLNGSTNLVLRLLHIDPTVTSRIVTEEEIRMMIDVGREAGNIHEEEKEMINKIFEFNDKEVSEIMTHRTGIVSLDVEADYDEVLELAVHEKYTRIPVYEDNVDNIIGVLHIKDLLYHAAEGFDGPFSLRQMIRPPVFVPESKNIDELFRDMQRDHTQMAIAIDEYGGTAGIVTIEDLLEEIVGNIQDEYDEEELEIERKDDQHWIVSGQADLDEVGTAINVEFPDDDFETLGGLVINLLGRIPEENELPEVSWEDIHFKVLAMDEKRIAKVEIQRISQVDPEETEES